ncbi:hypothetical protein [Streptomyces virginiae]|uniref:hypothetical protein n=1 Tax=Streptomyces virginiae TaxID=1961 RepID=UPI0022541D19|nr:hypothetical protein [Streptomyces virginiae]MCX5174263.1 hypothetical protein [Streptomyces virginiae]
MQELVHTATQYLGCAIVILGLVAAMRGLRDNRFTDGTLGIFLVLAGTGVFAGGLQLITHYASEAGLI